MGHYIQNYTVVLPKRIWSIHIKVVTGINPPQQAVAVSFCLYEKHKTLSWQVAKGKSISTEKNQQDQQRRGFLVILSAKRQTPVGCVQRLEAGV